MSTPELDDDARYELQHAVLMVSYLDHMAVAKDLASRVSDMCDSETATDDGIQAVATAAQAHATIALAAALADLAEHGINTY